jgi:succinoglycan biosynthesis protein ExoA
VFDKVGHFDERFDACEDVEFNYRVDRAGLRCFFTPNVSVRYRPRNSLSGLFRQIFRYGRGRVRLSRKHPATTSVGSFAPVALLAWICLSLILSPISTTAAIVGAATVGAYLFILFTGTVILAAWHKDWLLVPFLPIIWLVIHFSAAVGILIEFLLGRRSYRPAKCSEKPATSPTTFGQSSKLTITDDQNNPLNSKARKHILTEMGSD